jgi:hypothetical protein
MKENITRNPLLRSQRNAIFEAIQNVGLEPRDFDWTERHTKYNQGTKYIKVALAHRPTDYYFAFNLNEESSTYWPECSPGSDREVNTFGGITDRVNLLGFVRAWLTYLKREFTSPDLWAAISEEGSLTEAAIASDIDETPFTAKETTYISGALREIREYVFATHELSSEMHSFVNERFDYLEKSAKRQGRKAWIHTTIGVLFTIVVGAAFSSTAASELFQFAGNALSQVLMSQRLLP